MIRVASKLAKRITELESLLTATVVVSSKRLLPEWLLHTLHEETGLPFDTDEMALDSIGRMQTLASARWSASFEQHEKLGAANRSPRRQNRSGVPIRG